MTQPIISERPPARAGGTVQTAVDVLADPAAPAPDVLAAMKVLADALDPACECESRGVFHKGMIVCDDETCPLYMTPIREPRAGEARED